jgi:hypothetical protein
MGQARLVNDLRGPVACVVAAAATVVLAAGSAGTAAAGATPPERAAGSGWVVGTVSFGRHDSGVIVRVFRCVRRSRPHPAVNGCPAGARPQQVTAEEVRPEDARFRFQLQAGRYRIEDQLTRHSTPFGCVDATHKVNVRPNHATRLSLDADFLNAGCGNTY